MKRISNATAELGGQQAFGGCESWSTVAGFPTCAATLYGVDPLGSGLEREKIAVSHTWVKASDVAKLLSV